MRVIAGKAKGRVLTAPKGYQTRPIPAKIKEALFNVWQTRIADASFLDLFAGSGSIGIEALSRGARKVVFVERDRRAVNTIKRNLAACNFTDGYVIYQEDVFKRLARLKETGIVFDLVYLDPPFTVSGIFLPVMESLSNAAVLANSGAIAIRTPRELELPDRIIGLERTGCKRYGVSRVHFFKNAEAVT